MSSEMLYFRCTSCGHEQPVLVPRAIGAPGADELMTPVELVQAMRCPRCGHRDVETWDRLTGQLYGEGCLVVLLVGGLAWIPLWIFMGWPSALAISVTVGVVIAATRIVHRHGVYGQLSNEVPQLLEADEDGAVEARMLRTAVIVERGVSGQWERRWSRSSHELEAITATARGGLWAVGHGLALERGPGGWLGHLGMDLGLRACWEHDDVQVACGSQVIVAREEAQWQRDDRWAWEWYGIWGDEEQVWVVGDAGRIARRLGTGEWVEEPTDTERCLEGIWGNEEEVWAVGAGVILRREGMRWRSCELPVHGVRLRAIVVHEDVAWAVGDGGVVLCHRGPRWEACPSLSREVDWRAVWTEDECICAAGGSLVLTWDSAGLIQGSSHLPLASIRGGVQGPHGRTVVVGW